MSQPFYALAWLLQFISIEKYRTIFFNIIFYKKHALPKLINLQYLKKIKEKIRFFVTKPGKITQTFYREVSTSIPKLKLKVLKK